ncbi:MAG: fibronectin type III domain-containing protein, partial [Deltaproteobacteria bacterium]|nr:fibronectin type III domain-containing protein [Deltaproteobacteria bacterium]
MRPRRSSLLLASALTLATATLAAWPSEAEALVAVTLRSRTSNRSVSIPTPAADRTNRYFCALPEVFTFNLTGLTVGKTLSIWRGASCATLMNRRDAAQCERVGDADNITEATRELRLNADDLFDCTDTDASTKAIWFLVDESSDPDADVADAASIELGYDFSTPPSVTGAVSASAGETTLELEWDAPSSTDIDGYVILVEDLGENASGCSPTLLTPDAAITDEEIDALATHEDVGKTSESGTVGGLTVDHTYAVAVITEDEAGNYSTVSAVDCVTTVPTTDFWEAYRAAGGQAEECSVAAPGASSRRGWTSLWLVACVLGVGLAWRVARRRSTSRRRATAGQGARRRLSAGVAGAALLAGAIVVMWAPRPAEAQMRMLRESPQRFALALRFGPYYPDVDSEVGGAGGPFSTYFGDGARLLAGVELDIDAVIIPYVGRAGVGVGFAGTHFGGNTRTADNMASSESTGLTVFPMWVTAFLRVDTLARLVSVPLVFTARIGLENDVWLADDASGTTFGFRWALAAWLELDMFERRAARAMDENYGINHS